MVGTNKILASKHDITKGQTRVHETAILVLHNFTSPCETFLDFNLIVNGREKGREAKHKKKKKLANYAEFSLPKKR